MALESHIRELTAKHRNLDAMIAAEIRSAAADSMAVAAMKRQKLRLKETLERLRSAGMPADNQRS